MNSLLLSVYLVTGHGGDLLALAVTLLLLLSFIGWGNLLARAANIRRDTAHPLVNCLFILLGQALVCWLLGWLGYFHKFTGLTGALIVVSGVVFALPSVWGFLRHHHLQKNSLSGFRWLAPLLAVALVVLCIYLPPSLNLNDDSTAYAVFPLKIRNTGGLGIDPFSERRLFSLGAHYPLQALVLSLLPIRYFSITEPALGIALTLLFLGILLAKKEQLFSWRIVPGVLLLLLGCVAGSTVLANLAPAFLMVPALLLLIYASTRAPRFAKNSELLTYIACLGVLTALSTALRPTATPFAGILLILAVFHQAHSLKQFLTLRFVKTFVAAALGAAVFLLPFSLDLHRSSGTFLYPLLGRGFHATATGRVPSIPSVLPLSAHLKNLAHAPVSDWLLLLAGLGFLLLCIRKRALDRTIRFRLILVFAAMLVTYALIVYQTGGVDVHRYAAPMIISFLIYLIATAGSDKIVGRLQSVSRRARPSVAAASVVAFVPFALFSLVSYKRYPGLLHWIQAKIAVREQALAPSSEELEDYRRLQDATPEGSTILSTLQRNYVFDFNRNRVLINDQPGMIAPPPGWPFGNGGASFGEYLRHHDVQYVAVMRDALEPSTLSAPSQGWASITSHSSQRFYADLSDLPFKSSIVYESDRLRLYRVPKK